MIPQDGVWFDDGNRSPAHGTHLMGYVELLYAMGTSGQLEALSLLVFGKPLIPVLVGTRP